MAGQRVLADGTRAVRRLRVCPGPAGRVRCVGRQSTGQPNIGCECTSESDTGAKAWICGHRYNRRVCYVHVHVHVTKQDLHVSQQHEPCHGNSSEPVPASRERIAPNRCPPAENALQQHPGFVSATTDTDDGIRALCVHGCMPPGAAQRKGATGGKVRQTRLACSPCLSSSKNHAECMGKVGLDLIKLHRGKEPPGGSPTPLKAIDPAKVCRYCAVLPLSFK